MKINDLKLCLDLFKKKLVVLVWFVGLNANAYPLNAIQLKWVSLGNQECEVRSAMISINSTEPLFYPYSIIINRCSGSYNVINNPFAKLCVADVVKDTNIKVFNLMSRTNKTRHISWHKTCACKCRYWLRW